jgi:hypothetical protein
MSDTPILDRYSGKVVRIAPFDDNGTYEAIIREELTIAVVVDLVLCTFVDPSKVHYIVQRDVFMSKRGIRTITPTSVRVGDVLDEAPETDHSF